MKAIGIVLVVIGIIVLAYGGYATYTTKENVAKLGPIEVNKEYAGRASMERRARREVEKGHSTVLFKLMEERGRTRLTSAIWAHALEAHDKLAIHLIDRAVQALGAGVASAVNLLDVQAVVVGGWLG